MSDAKTQKADVKKVETKKSEGGETTPWTQKDQPALHEKHDTAVKYDKDQIGSGTTLPRKS